MMSDRSYMSQPRFEMRRSASIMLLFILGGCFVAQMIAEHYFGLGPWIRRWLSLQLDGILHGHIWQLVTYQFLHTGPGPWHLLGNLLSIYFFGRIVEDHVGTTRFLQTYFGGGIVGALLHVAVTAVLRAHIDPPVVGASAGCFAIVALYARLFPMQEVTIFILFIPVNLRAIYLLWFFGLVSIYGTIIPFDNVAHAAHLGGIAAGWLAERIFSGNLQLPKFPTWKPRTGSGAPASTTATTPRRAAGPHTTPVPPKPTDDFISREVDPILEKISARGIHSLTAEERKILENARKRITNRR